MQLNCIDGHKQARSQQHDPSVCSRAGLGPKHHLWHVTDVFYYLVSSSIFYDYTLPSASSITESCFPSLTSLIALRRHPSSMELLTSGDWRPESEGLFGPTLLYFFSSVPLTPSYNNYIVEFLEQVCLFGM